MTTKTVTPTIAVNVNQLKDDVETLLTSNGFTLNDLARLKHQQDYRRKYAQRPEVKSKRALYNKVRSRRMQVLKGLLRG